MFKHPSQLSQFSSVTLTNRPKYEAVISGTIITSYRRFWCHTICASERNIPLRLCSKRSLPLRIHYFSKFGLCCLFSIRHSPEPLLDHVFLLSAVAGAHESHRDRDLFEGLPNEFYSHFHRFCDCSTETDLCRPRRFPKKGTGKKIMHVSQR